MVIRDERRALILRYCPKEKAIESRFKKAVIKLGTDSTNAAVLSDFQTVFVGYLSALDEGSKWLSHW
ncbi:hypothetical protein [Photobacterium lipolyticum]|uniref:Uncharacterized protein n=1 Tax=Photobacterium lipolyticum TaxID=266810 RepID=A0A2T3MSM4_9GAMM|nr:hypothetical protein [Photobacterium lipolyticum]PSW01152.1 hypothetical protein C9I89_20340 [Photobacterium lipolyticum]